MIYRYAINEINTIWSEQNKLEMWLKVEIEIVKAWSKINVIPINDVDKIIQNAKINLKRMWAIEQETKHDVVAFTRMISETLSEESRWIHLGITSTDVVDTAQNLLIKQSCEILLTSIKALNQKVYQLALEHQQTLMMGRSHGIYGEPTSLGLKFLLWHEEINRQIKRIKLGIDDVCVTKVSGSMGNYANLEIEIEAIVADALEMPTDLVSTQVSQRDRLASLILAIANYATSLEKMATEIRLYQRSEVKELMEGFGANQKGSSSMPHKKNPISSENISGLVRMLKAYVIPALENNVLWHERDISHSSNERIILPDMFNLAIYTTRRMDDVLNNLVINQNQMQLNIQQANNIFYSQPILTEIIRRTNFTREEIYDFIQKCSLEAMQNNQDFIQVLKNNQIEKFISISALDEICQMKYFLRNVEKIYLRLKNAKK